MSHHVALVSLVVREYDEAISYYRDVLGFELVEDSPIPEQGKRWVVMRPRGSVGFGVVLARASTELQATRIGNQTGGRVFLFLHTDNFARDYDSFRTNGVVFVRPPHQQPYGMVAVFKDLYGNLWDLVQPTHNEHGET